MAIKRYFATKDNTITNAYEQNLKTRATGSNMGAADILEVFSIYGQASSTSSEKSRILIQFPITNISTDRTAGTIPASGSVNFYLKMYNAPHSFTVPKSYTLDIKPVSGSWQEGYGLDMDNYTDLTFNNTGSNWTVATSVSAAATATVTVVNEGWVEADDTISLVSADGTTIVCTMHGSTTTSASTSGNVQAAIGASTTATATNIATAINYNTLFSATSSGAVVTITQVANGRSGNTDITITEGGATGFSKTNFTGGDGDWVTAGADYHSGSFFTASFDKGTEDLEVDVTELVEEWIAGDEIDNNGFGIMFASSHENASRSYYTKKFFGRGTEFFFRRPTIEARWDSTKRDDRGNFYYSSSLADGADNLNTLYLYNYVRGQLKNIPEIGAAAIYVDLYSGSSPSPEDSPLSLSDMGTRTGPATGSNVSTGIYKCNVCVTASSPPLTKLYDVWHGGDGKGTYFTGSITPKGLSGSDINPTFSHVTSMTNLKSIYRRHETARFRLFARQKDWSPTIYTKATKTIKSDIISSGSYRVYRVIDEYNVVPYGTGSEKHTVMSYDLSGSYFDLDMSMLESDYAYAIEVSYYNGAIGSWVKQPEIFKFRVE